jgi:hypothetical protein
MMGQVSVHVTLTNARELVMSQLGRHALKSVHTCEVEALIDTERFYSIVPKSIAHRLGLAWFRQSAMHPDGRWGEGEVTEAVQVDLYDRPATIDALVMGKRVQLSASVLGQTDLRYDKASGELRPNIGTWKRPVFRV